MKSSDPTLAFPSVKATGKVFEVVIPFVKNAGPLVVKAEDKARAAARAAVARAYPLLKEVGIV